MSTEIKMGWEGLLYIGTAGSQAATQVINCTDVNLNIDMDTGKTTRRGNGSARPIETESVTVIKWGADWTMINRASDAVLQTILTAAAAGNPIAVRMKDHTAGKGYDGDVNVKFDHGEPLAGEQTYKISVTPNEDLRTPQIYV